jgi:manganese efflux pump family protein
MIVFYRLFLVSISVGLGNFAAAIGIGMGGVNAATRLRIAIVFGFFEGFMPIVGLLVGEELAGLIGQFGNYVGAALLVLTGAYSFWQARTRRKHSGQEQREKVYTLKVGRLLLMGFVLGVDNLVVGFALGFYNVPLLLAVVFIATVSVLMSLIGLELGRYLGARFEEWSEMVGSLILIIVGLGLGFGLL